jgi:hypothetical protein
VLAESLLDPKACEATIGSLLNMHVGLAQNAAARDEFKSTDFIANLVSVMKQQRKDYNLVSKCCILLTSFTCNNGHFKYASLNAGAAEAIVQAMNESPHEGKMQRFGCLALNNLVYLHDHSGASRMIQAGAINTLLLAFKTHSHCRITILYASRCLWTIIHYHPGCSTELIENGIIELVLESMTFYLTDPKVQSNACGFLAEFCTSNPETARRIKEQGGVMVVGATEHYYRGNHKNVETLAGKLLQILYKE